MVSAVSVQRLKKRPEKQIAITISELLIQFRTDKSLIIDLKARILRTRLLALAVNCLIVTSRLQLTVSDCVIASAVASK